MISYFFDAHRMPDGSFDREYQSADHANYYSSIFTNGLFVKRDLSACEVTASGGTGGEPWILTVASGRVFVNGYQGITDGTDEFQTSTLQNGFYRVIIRLDVSEDVRDFACELVFGSDTGYPALVREGNVYDLCLADVSITDGVPTVTDTRYDEDLCGQVEFAANPMQPPYYPPTDLPQDLWTYSAFPKTMTPEQIAQFESNPNLMDMFSESRVNRLRYASPEIAAKYGLPDPTVNDLLGVLSGAAMIKEVGGEPIRTPVALSSVPVGTTIMVSVNGTDMPFIVAQLNYPSSGNTLLVASVAFAAAGRPAWAIDIGAVYNGSTLDGICNTTFINALSDTTRNAVQTVSIASFGATLQRKGFSLSATELGNYGSYTPSYTEGNLLTLSATLRPVFSAASWTRSQYSSAPLWNAIKYEGNAASYMGKTSDNQCYVRPAFCLPQTFTAYKEGNTYYTDQAYANTTLAAATVLGEIIGGFTRIETGEYTGTGDYGTTVGYKFLTLAASFEPKLALIQAKDRSSFGVYNPQSAYSYWLLAIRGTTAVNTYGGYSYAGVGLDWAGNTLSLKNTQGTANNFHSQMNAAGVTYQYIFLA